MGSYKVTWAYPNKIGEKKIFYIDAKTKAEALREAKILIPVKAFIFSLEEKEC